MKTAKIGSVAIFLTLLMLAACSSDTSDAEKSVVGKWIGQDKDSDKCPDTIQLFDDEDNTFNMTYPDEKSVAGTYDNLEQDDNYKLRIKDEVKIFKFIRDGDQLTASDADGNEPCEYKLEDEDHESEETTKNTNNENETSKTDDENETSKTDDEKGNDDNQTVEVEDQGDANIWFKGKATFDGKDVTVDGTTNLLPGSDLAVLPDGEDATFIGSGNHVKVEDDGTFHFEDGIPSDYDGKVLLEIQFNIEDQDNDEIKEHYKPTQKKLGGPFTYLKKDGDELVKTAIAKLEFPKNEDEATLNINAPGWNKPDDYGSSKVWMKAEVNKDKDYVRVKGTSNLLEGTKVAAYYEIPGKTTIGYNDFPEVKPDGSFKAKIKNPEKEKSLKHYSVQLEVRPSNNEWPNVKEAYGEKGEKFKGPLTEKKRDSTSIIKKIKVK